MPAPSLNNVGQIIVKKSPAGSKRLYYFAKRSSPLGVVPPQLKGNSEKMKSVAPQCAQETRSMPAGPERVAAFRACVGQKM